MSSFAGSIKGVFSSDHAMGALFLAISAIIVSELIPNPGDAVTLKIQRDLRDEWKSGTISASEYWRRTVFAHTAPTVVWWILVLLIVVNAPVKPQHKIYLALLLVGAGASAAIVFDLYKKDKENELNNI